MVDSVDMEIESLREYVWKSDEKLLKEVHAEEIIGKEKKKDEIRKQTNTKIKLCMKCFWCAQWKEGMLTHGNG